MNVSIFLRQFGSADNSSVIVQWLRDGDSSRLGAERLRALLRIVPEPHEIQLLTPYIDRRTTTLAAAERFYVQLIALPKCVASSIIIIIIIIPVLSSQGEKKNYAMQRKMSSWNGPYSSSSFTKLSWSRIALKR